MKISFVVVCYNNEDLLDTCIQSIQQQTHKDYEIILVDNGSVDKSVEHVKKHYPEVTLIEAGKNTGFAIGNNIGIKKALEDPDCSYVAFLNSDATIDADWSETLLNFAATHPKSAGLQAPTLDYYDHTILDSRGITIDPEGRARQLGHREVYKARESHVVFGAHAAACIYNAEFLRTQAFGDDFFDSDLWMYLEDVDLAARGTITGWQSWYVDGSFGYHMGSASSSKNPGFSVYMCYRNNYPMLLKNLPVSHLVYATFGAAWTDLVTLASLLRGKNYIPLKAIIKGRVNGWQMIPLFLKKRKSVRKSSQISKQDLKKLMHAK